MVTLSGAETTGGAAWGVTDPTAPLRRVLVRPPDAAFAVADPERWNYVSSPELATARAEHAALVEVLRGAGAEVMAHDAPLGDLADSIFVFDPAFMTAEGAVVLRMGKRLRRGEEPALEERLTRAGVPIVGRITGDGRVEGGDLLRLDAGQVALGLGFRTNEPGAEQLSRILARQGTELLRFDLPVLEGERACLHLRSLVSLLAPDLAVVYRPLLPVRLWRLLAERFELVEVPQEELGSMGPNVLALGPRLCLMLEGNPTTRRRLEDAGCEVLTYRGEELSLKAEGGPTCLTLPLLRADD